MIASPSLLPSPIKKDLIPSKPFLIMSVSLYLPLSPSENSMVHSSGGHRVANTNKALETEEHIKFFDIVMFFNISGGLSVYLLETGSGVGQPGLELWIFLPPLPKYRCIAPCPPLH